MEGELLGAAPLDSLVHSTFQPIPCGRSGSVSDQERMVISKGFMPVWVLDRLSTPVISAAVVGVQYAMLLQ